MTPIRILLIDDNETFLKQAARYLEREADLDVVGTASSGTEGVRRATALQPEVVLLDQSMPGESGIDTIARLKQALPTCHIIMLTMHGPSGYRERALHHGADGYVTKGRMLDDLLPEIRRLVV